MKYRLQDLIDIDHFQRLQGRLNDVCHFPSSIIDNTGNILTATGWQDICTKFHRKDQDSERLCVTSNQSIQDQFHEGRTRVTYHCPHGLVDNAIPIIIDGTHYGSFFTGQYFLEPPDMDFFRSQAIRYGFNEEAYLRAVKKVPIWTKAQVRSYLAFIKELIDIIALTGLKQINALENGRRIEKSRHLHQSIIQTAMNGFWLTDSEGNLLEVNDAYCAMSGYTKDELLAMRISDLETNESPEMLARHMQTVKKKGADRFESRHRRKDGTVFDLEISVQARKESGGRYVVFLRDTTDRKASLTALKESKDRYESIFHNAQVGLSRMRISDGKILECNQKMAQIFGYDTVAEFLSTGVFSERYVHKELREQILSELTKTGFIHNKEAQFYKKDGQVVWVRFDSRIVPDKGYMEDVVIDISQQKKAEEKILQQKKAISLNNKIANVFLTSSGSDIFSDTLDVILDTLESPFGFFGFIDADGNLNCPSVKQNAGPGCNAPGTSVFFAKDDWGEILGESLGQARTIISDTAFELPYQQSQLHCALTVPIIHHNQPIGQFLIANRNGGYTHYEQFLLEQAASQTAPILHNLLEEQARETEHRKLQARIEQAQKMETIGNLAGGIAHDFNNILFPILGHSEMLLDEISPENKFAYDSVSQIHSSALRAKNLVQQILTFSRQETTEYRPLNIQLILKEAVKFLRATTPKDIEIYQRIDPQCGLVNADPTQMHQVIMNLATNACHAMEEQGGQLTVELKQAQILRPDAEVLEIPAGNYACLSVSDTGIGMPQEISEKIFDPYFTTKGKGKGTGIGLSVVQGIVQKMNGHIRVSSEKGQGTEFKLYFPLEKTATTPYEFPASQYLPRGSERILLVDDEKPIITLEKQALERLGYEVTIQTSPKDALEIVKNRPQNFDLVITDLSMPEMNGDVLAAKVLEIRSDMPILICTGFSDRFTHEIAREMGVKEVLMKPIIIKELSTKIRNALDKG